jgi:nicotinamidase-related amidase
MSVPEPPKIRQATTAVVFNGMINHNLVSADPHTQQIIDDSRIVENSAALVAEARKRGMRVIWILIERRADMADVVFPITDVLIASNMDPGHPVTAGSEEAMPPEALTAQPEDLKVYKVRYDAFIGTNLDQLLRGNGIDTILLGGVATNFGVESTARTARDHGYNVVVLRDCSLNVNLEAHEVTLKHVLPRFARIMSSKDALGLLE